MTAFINIWLMTIYVLYVLIIAGQWLNNLQTHMHSISDVSKSILPTCDVLYCLIINNYLLFTS